MQGRSKLPKTIAATALAAAALGVAPVAQAGTGAPQKHPEIIAILKHSELKGVAKHPDIIGVLKRLQMRKAGGDGNA